MTENKILENKDYELWNGDCLELMKNISDSGNSSFKRTIGKSNNSIVFESLYIKEY